MKPVLTHVQLLNHGLPAARVIVEALQRRARRDSQAFIMPDGLTRGALIRSLSVLISSLETACKPQQAMYSLCQDAAKALSRTLDDILDGPSTSGPTVPNTNEPSLQDLSAASDVGNLEQVLWNDCDLSDWLKNVDCE
jgi:hypothetical protein